VQLSNLQERLIENWQRAFPLVPQPYETIGAALGATECDVIHALGDLQSREILSRVGAAVRPNSAGASTLAAMSVPAHDLARVAGIVNAEAGVNHNYEREHAFNLWFVVTGCDQNSVQGALSRVRGASGYRVLDLPLKKPYFIDLGFSLNGNRRPKQRENPSACLPHRMLTAAERQVLHALEGGLPLEARPYSVIAERVALSEEGLIAALGALSASGVIARFGLIVRHRALGFEANAMVVWDVPDGDADSAGEAFAQQSFVTLCYRRPRRLPDWPYNLFCMIHGRERGWVLDRVRDLRALAGPAVRSAVLFSRRCFKQRGARFSAA
jgi:DNA-binding Lrp family transcriptional regulator